MATIESGTNLNFRTRLLSLPEATVNNQDSSYDNNPAQQKKNARKEISLTYTSEKLGFLHAALIEIRGSYYLLAGPSGVGKTTYGRALTEQLGAEVLANDWVAIEKDGDNFFISDLNFSESIKHKERCPFAGVLFLTPSDQAFRDAYVPNPEEYYRLLDETFDTSTPEEVGVLSKFWLSNRSELPLCFAVPTRQSDEKYVSGTLINIFNRVQGKQDEVGVIGLGSFGSQLAFQLGQLDSVRKVHLYNRSPDKTIGLAQDMNQAFPNKKEVIFMPHLDPSEVFMYSSAVFLSFRDQSPVESSQMHERWQRISKHALIAQEYGEIASNQNFDGTIFMLSNPVDILTYILYYTTQAKDHPLRTYQVYGSGLEVDSARAVYSARQLGLDLNPELITIYGNHSDVYKLETPLSVENNHRIMEKVLTASEEIRKCGQRTIYGPASAALRSFIALLKNGRTSLATIQKNLYIGQPLEFHRGLPMMRTNTNMDFTGIPHENMALNSI